jgi:hypothetical protein
MKRVLLISLSLLVLALGIMIWAHHTVPSESILTSLPSSDGELFLRSNRTSVGEQPILLLIDKEDPNVFSRYIAEILKAEGIFAFETIDISAGDLESRLINSYALVITATTSRNLQTFKSILSGYVSNGGRLFMLSPPPEFDSLLGVKTTAGSLNDGYIQFDAGAAVARGLSKVPLQYFGTARQLRTTSSNVVAHLLTNDFRATPYSAAGINSFGKGKTGFLAFDLGRSIVIARQGKPPASNNSEYGDKDGDGIYRTADLFYDTFDYSETLVPQADEQQKFFVKLLYALLDCDPVIPRVWYFPDGNPCVALVTGDTHGNWGGDRPDSISGRMFDYVERRGGHYTLFDYPDQLSTKLASTMTSRGHTISPHIYYPRSSNVFFLRIKLFIANGFSRSTYFFRPRLSDLRDEVDFAVETFHNRTGSAPTLTRTHYLTWWGWTETAQLLAQYGIRMDFSITGMNPHNIFVVPTTRLRSPAGYGYINGSGQPMKFMNSEGKLINLFSQLTQVEDDVIAAAYVASPPNDSLTIHKLIEVNRRLIDESVDDYNTALVYNFHPEHALWRFPPNAPVSWQWITATIDYLSQRKVPMLSGDTWLHFVEARHNIRMNRVTYNPFTHKSTFTLSCPLDVQGLTLLLPIPRKAINFKSVDVYLESKPLNRLATRTSRKTVNGMAYLELILNLQANVPVIVSYSF